MTEFGAKHVLLGLYVLLVGTGAYVTYIGQGGTLDELNEKIAQVEERDASLESLRAREREVAQRAEEIRERSRTRYKRIPRSLSTPDIMSYISKNTQHGFDAFDLTSEGSQSEEGYNVHVFKAKGEAVFSSLYRLIWTLENNRPFYRIRNLQLRLLEKRTTDEDTGRSSMDVLVSFQMEVEAIYGVAGGIGQASGSVGSRDGDGLPVARTEQTPPVPAQVLPPATPEINPFYPLIFDQVPPNEHGRLNLDTARLVSVVEGQAIFETTDGLKRVGEGDRVYLGRIVEVDPNTGRVVARLNKGGIIDRVVRSVSDGATTTVP